MSDAATVREEPAPAPVPAAPREEVPVTYAPEDDPEVRARLVEIIGRILARYKAREAADRERNEALRVAHEALAHLRATFRWGCAPELLTDEDREIVRAQRWLDPRETLARVIDPALAAIATARKEAP